MPMARPRKPTPQQIFAARIRWEAEQWQKKNGKPLSGGLHLPPKLVLYQHLSEKFGLALHEIPRFLTFSRTCEHSWRKACPECPVPEPCPEPRST